MKSSNSHGNFRPFKDLQALLEEKAIKLKPNLKPPKPSKTGVFDATAVDQRSDRLIFQEAMTGVRKISRSNRALPSPSPPRCTNSDEKVDEKNFESLIKLKELISKGTGFIVSLTPEYVEGTAHNVSPEVARRLHRGYFSIQAHIDLHGLGIHDARQAVDEFLNKSILEGKRAVLVIHGRGLSSPYQPVLKTKIYQWLTAAPWHKWVIAFTSARMCDGGAGATYILLRQQPLTKRYRKRNNVRS